MNSKEMVLSIFATVFKIVLAVIIIMMVYKWSLLAYEYGTRVFNEPPMSAGEGRVITVVIEEGATAMEIGHILEKKGLIRDARLFRVQEMLSAYKDKLQSGTFELKTSMTTDEIMRIIASESRDGE
jgi:UPF0755 protein